MFGVVDHIVDDTWYLYFLTLDSSGGSVTITGLAKSDIKIFKDGNITQRASENGYTLLDTDGMDFDGMVGIHGISVDSSDNSIDSFYAAGSHYLVAIDAITADGQTVRFFFQRTIGKLLHPTTAGRTLDVNAGGEAGLDLDNTSGTIDAAQLGADCITNAKIADEAIAAENLATGALTADAFAANALVAATFAASSLDGKGDWSTLTQTQVTGGAYPLDADGSGRVRLVSGTAAGEISLSSGLITAMAGTVQTFDGLVITLALQLANGLSATQGNLYDRMLAFTQLLARKDAGIATDRSTELDLINANEGAGGGAYDNTRESVEALRDRGDAAWLQGSGGDATEAKQNTIISTLGTVAKTGADSDTLETLSDQIDGIEGGTGSGARTVAVTVNDGADALENAIVRFTEGANTYAGPTDASGEISFSLDDATYAVAISKVGYTFTPTTLVVDGDKTPTYSMAAVTISAPPNASTTTGVMTVYDEEGSVEEGVEVSVQIIDGPGTAGIGYDSTVWTETSSALGVVEFAGIILGGHYRIWRGDSKPSAETFTAPSSGDSFDLAEVIGRG